MGERNKAETSVQVTGLKPSHFYNIRVIASAPTNFSTLGQLIRLRTLPSSGAKASDSAITDAVESTNDHESHEAAAVRPAPLQYESAVVPQIARESSGGALPSKRTASGRRNSPPLQSAEQSPSHPTYTAGIDRNGSEDSVECLTRTLDSLRQEIQDLERQTQEEDAQARMSVADLTNERDQLRQLLKEREDATAELRKQGNHLDKVHRLAQSRKAQTEQSLNQKKAERQKMIDNVARWEKEIIDLRQSTQDMINQKALVLSTKESDFLVIRRSAAEEQAAVRVLEEEIHATGVEIKALEKDRERFAEGGNEEQQLAKQDRDDEEDWETQAQVMHGELGRLWQTLHQVRTCCIESTLPDILMKSHSSMPRTIVPRKGWPGG